MDFDYIKVGIATLFVGENISVNQRFENASLVYSLFERSLLIGWGSAALFNVHTVDSEYLLILQRYGIVGIILFLSYIDGRIAVVDI